MCAMRLTLWILVMAVMLHPKQSCADMSAAYVLQTQTLPEDRNFMPSLANGHLGYTLFGDSIFMAGVYNGAGSKSRRARMPNWANISASVCVADTCTTAADLAANGTTYEMDLRDGYFRYRQHYKKLGVTLEQRSYPHRYYTRAIVYEVVATRSTPPVRDAKENAPRLQLKFEQQPGNDSDAFDFVVSNNGAHRVLHGRTKIVENELFQKTTHEIYVVFSENFEQPVSVAWPAEQTEFRYQIIMTADRQRVVAQKEMQDVQKLTPVQLLASHTDAWHNFWNWHFSVEIVGDLELWRIINAGIYYVASSLPALASNQPNLPCHGLSPTGLARGNLDADYQGHSFWDTEIWLLPLITQFSFAWVQQLLDYRQRLLPGAQYNAQLQGYKGARYPWESAYTGTEVTNPCCPEVAHNEIHISPDIAFALQKYYAVTQDRNWLCQTAWPLATGIAEFLVSRVDCANDICHLRAVMGPDEDHAQVDDNVYTNVVASIALEFAAFTADVCDSADGKNETRQQWLHIAERLHILYDASADYHPQHVGYQQGEQVKQADTILLGYPLLFNMSGHTHLNDLRIYANATRPTGPAMTWSMFAINYLRSAEAWRADDYFERGYKSYVRPEFKVWSETPVGTAGSANFLTGFGGFMQTLINGYAGVDYTRVDSERCILKMRLRKLPPNVQSITFKYLRFSSNYCKVTISAHTTRLKCYPVGQKLEVIRGSQSTIYASNFTVTINNDETITMQTTL